MIAVYPLGVPLLLVGVMYPRREAIEKMMRGIKEEDERRGSIVRVKDVRTAEKQRRPSIVDLTKSLAWLVPKFEKFEVRDMDGCIGIVVKPSYSAGPLVMVQDIRMQSCVTKSRQVLRDVTPPQSDRWWYGPFSLVVRLCQSSVMICFQTQITQALYACIMTQVAICAQQNLIRYRRASDNETALLAQWLIFVWCMVFTLKVTGSLASVQPPLIIGVVCVLATLALFARSLWTTAVDIKGLFSSDPALEDDATEDGDDDQPIEIEMTDMQETSTSLATESQSQPRQGGEPSHDEEVSFTLMAPLTSAWTVWESALCASQPDEGRGAIKVTD